MRWLVGTNRLIIKLQGLIEFARKSWIFRGPRAVCLQLYSLGLSPHFSLEINACWRKIRPRVYLNFPFTSDLIFIMTCPSACARRMRNAALRGIGSNHYCSEIHFLHFSVNICGNINFCYGSNTFNDTTWVSNVSQVAPRARSSSVPCVSIISCAKMGCSLFNALTRQHLTIADR